MKTNTFLELLETHNEKSLLFEYQQGNFVGANYHITEVKNVQIDAVDCGARSDSWEETLIQLWESPDEKDTRSFMTAYKALGILKKVNRIRPIAGEAELKFEYGNENFHTAQLFVNEYTWSERQIIIKLAVEQTTCKARESCGVPQEVEKVAETCCAESACC